MRADFARSRLLREGRGWTADVLRCVREFARETGRTEFALAEFTARYEHELARLYPGNRHVAPKIRQQLQVLRDRGILALDRRGRYWVAGQRPRRLPGGATFLA